VQAHELALYGLLKYNNMRFYFIKWIRLKPPSFNSKIHRILISTKQVDSDGAQEINVETYYSH
jgi:hypothetical protein